MKGLQFCNVLNSHGVASKRNFAFNLVWIGAIKTLSAVADQIPEENKFYALLWSVQFMGL